MGVTTVVHAVDSRFFDAFARQPALMDWWLGYEEEDLGLDGERFAAHPRVSALAGPEGLGTSASTDEGRHLERHLDAIVCLLAKAFPDERTAWDALAGTSSEEFQVTPLGDHWGLGTVCTRRIAGLLEVMGCSFRVSQAWDAQLLTALNIPPGYWDEPEALAEFEASLRNLVRTLDDAARSERAVIFAVNL